MRYHNELAKSHQWSFSMSFSTPMFHQSEPSKHPKNDIKPHRFPSHDWFFTRHPAKFSRKLWFSLAWGALAGAWGASVRNQSGP